MYFTKTPAMLFGKVRPAWEKVDIFWNVTVTSVATGGTPRKPALLVSLNVQFPKVQVSPLSVKVHVVPNSEFKL